MENKIRDFSSLRLTIYYLSYQILLRCPLNEFGLVNFVNNMSIREPNYAQKIIVSGQQLNEHADLLNQLNNLNLIPVPIEIKEKPNLNARVHYVFETKDGTSVCRVTMKGQNGCIFVNGKPVEKDVILYEVLIPFLYGEALGHFQRVISHLKS